jgi:GTPase
LTTEQTTANFKSGYVTILGEPNVGKSTLLNSLLRQKISIVTNKPQTTRHKILGILSEENYQIIFLDTPGIISPKYLLQEVMMEVASSAVDDADVVALMIDADKMVQNAGRVNNAAFDKIKTSGKKTFLIINKIDKIEKGKLLPMMDAFNKQFSFEEIVPISALRKEGTEDLVRLIVQYLPVHSPFFPTDIVSEAPEKFFVGEIIREKIFEQFSQEIPYSTAVDVVTFAERASKKHLISAEIYVERDSQKGILIGKGGSALKSVGEKARKDIEEFLGHPVFLELHVKVREHWRSEEAWLKRLGYEGHGMNRQ